EDKKFMLPSDAAVNLNLAEQTRKVLATLTPREEKVLRKNDKLLFFTDGIYECCNPAGDFFGKDRLYAAVEKNRELPIQKLVNEVFATAQNFCQSAKPDDDMSLLGIEYTGGKSAEYII
ncbi:MAG: SpoIIE family protein phosphatase, partial [Nitrosopumilaceae archaeon]